jgi:hypothetical protein
MTALAAKSVDLVLAGLTESVNGAVELRDGALEENCAERIMSLRIRPTLRRVLCDDLINRRDRLLKFDGGIAGLLPLLRLANRTTNARRRLEAKEVATSAALDSLTVAAHSYVSVN